jgi:hypothetical protein
MTQHRGRRWQSGPPRGSEPHQHKRVKWAQRTTNPKVRIRLSHPSTRICMTALMILSFVDWRNIWRRPGGARRYSSHSPRENVRCPGCSPTQDAQITRARARARAPVPSRSCRSGGCRSVHSLSIQYAAVRRFGRCARGCCRSWHHKVKVLPAARIT